MIRHDKPGRRRAAWTLALMTTLCAELTFTAVAVPSAWLLLPLLLVMYGAGVLLIRELVVRTGGGWPGPVVLGLAYQLAEDGLGLQALTSPRCMVPPIGDSGRSASTGPMGSRRSGCTSC